MLFYLIPTNTLAYSENGNMKDEKIINLARKI